MAKKAKTVYRGYLIAQDAKQWDPNDKDFAAYWNKVKDNLFVVGNLEEKKIKFLNRELKALAKKYEGVRVRITVEQDPEPPSARAGKMPDPNEEFQGFEKFKRVAMNLFKIS
ncbi:MAG: hypothetical protein JW839_07380 [Candidatus Lokiarchaeota archaeon]|nr:hypothetical protein [Candidatus Lokiarchaeota archaeon]